VAPEIVCDGTMTGPATFVRFGYPPNALGYCGPSNATAVAELSAGGNGAGEERERLITAFLGAWPYLELIAGRWQADPLDERVVEAYWLGNPLLDEIDPLSWGNSLEARFKGRAGWDWEAITTALNAGGVPNHAFHVFCVYPWVGLLREGAADPSLQILDQCRIRWGRVDAVSDGRVFVKSRPLGWDGETLGLGAYRIETVEPPIGPGVAPLRRGDRVAMHWNFVCQRLTDDQLLQLRRNHYRHLAIVNRAGRRLALRIEG
jgi:hypothetical protein